MIERRRRGRATARSSGDLAELAPTRTPRAGQGGHAPRGAWPSIDVCIATACRARTPTQPAVAAHGGHTLLTLSGRLCTLVHSLGAPAGVRGVAATTVKRANDADHDSADLVHTLGTRTLYV